MGWGVCNPLHPLLLEMMGNFGPFNLCILIMGHVGSEGGGNVSHNILLRRVLFGHAGGKLIGGGLGS